MSRSKQLALRDGFHHFPYLDAFNVCLKSLLRNIMGVTGGHFHTCTLYGHNFKKIN